MKACLYNEQAPAVEPIDEHRLAIADAKPARVEAPRQSYYIVNYKVLGKATLIAFLILVVFAIALWLL